MAAPNSKTLQDLNGKWTVNKSSSDDFTRVLSLQGVSALIRKAAATASVHLTITQPDKQHIKLQQQVTAGKIPGISEDYTLDWEWRTNKDALFGEVQGRSRWISVDDARKAGVADEAEWIEGDSEGQLMQAEGRKPDGEWQGAHLWGFEMVDGERKHTRRVRMWNKEGEELRVRLVYDFDG